jgi:DNA-binding NtrC family response regulator
VLISGESGTGKELLAHRIHHLSHRRDGPFVVVDSAALVESLAESELFGHEKGAFTGAVGRRLGRFEQADRGTLFLDEIGELPEGVQAKLLRVLETGHVERVGGGAPLQVDFRLVAASNRNLEAEVRRGRFRPDLFFRLDVVHLQVPPLRRRPGDLALLVGELSRSLAETMGRTAPEIAPDALAQLGRYDWPGNVRELRNVLERALVASSAPRLTAADFSDLIAGTQPPNGANGRPLTGGSLSLEERERQVIFEALRQTAGHRERAAELLGISVRTLYHRLKKYGGL